MEWIEGKKEAKRLVKVPGRSRFDNILTYLGKPEGMAPIGDAHPFNEVDALVLARLSYLSFEGLVGADFNGYQPTIASLVQPYVAATSAEGGLMVMDATDTQFMKALGQSPRFSSMRLCGYRLKFSVHAGEQFAAMTVLFPDGRAYVAFRGTDGTLIGWREDFDIALKGAMPADVSALAYWKDCFAALKGNGRRFMLGGHSKGGHMAAYAALFGSDEERNAIDRLWLFDSPGFTHNREKFPDVDRLYLALSLKDRISSYGPTQSLIGMILYGMAPMIPVLSKKSLVWQHDPYQWQIEGTRFVRSSFSPMSWAMKKASKDIFQDMDNRYLGSCIDAFFSALSAGDTLDEAKGGGMGPVRAFGLLLMLRRIPKEKRSGFLSFFDRLGQQMKLMAEAEKKRIAVSKNRKSSERGALPNTGKL